MSDYPVLLHTAIDARDCRGLAEFYRELLGLHYREGDEPPTDSTPDDADWLVLLDDNGHRVVTVQQKADTTPPTWPSEAVPMQMHMDFRVPTRRGPRTASRPRRDLGARLLYDRSAGRRRAALRARRPGGAPVLLCSSSRLDPQPR